MKLIGSYQFGVLVVARPTDECGSAGTLGDFNGITHYSSKQASY